ncbi:unnamed protein product [marine sediment metagenome]|uniref:Uncharacterized protein n=1 Tax=marine sediment metagenome TaxID=412755 RepID=X1BFV7_9ZZZZ
MDRNEAERIRDEAIEVAEYKYDLVLGAAREECDALCDEALEKYDAAVEIAEAAYDIAMDEDEDSEDLEEIPWADQAQSTLQEIIEIAELVPVLFRGHGVSETDNKADNALDSIAEIAESALE